MKKIDWLSYAGHLVILFIFIIASAIYFFPALEGKIVYAGDNINGKAAVQESAAFHQQTGEYSFWTGSMFSGMPATQISVDYKGDATTPLYNLLFWGERPPSYLIISLIGGFLLFLAFGINPYLAAVGAIAITFCSYNMQIIQVGHNTKMVAIAFMPWVKAALVYA